MAHKKPHKSTQKRKAATEAGADADKPDTEEATKEEEDSDDEALKAHLKKVTCCVQPPRTRLPSDKAVP